MFDFLQEKKPLLYIVLGILAIGLVGLLVFRFFSPGTPQTEENGGEGATGGVTPPAPPAPPPPPPGSNGEPPPEESPETRGEARLLHITDFPVVSPTLNKTANKVLFYRKDGGDLLSVDLNGLNQEKISNLTILGLIEALWSPVKDRATLFSLDGELLKSFLHTGTSTIIAFPTDIKSFSWSPDGKSLAYLLKKDSRLHLTLADSLGKKPRAVFRTSIPDAQINWISTDKIAFQNAPSGIAEGYIFLYSVAGKTFRKSIGPLYGLTSRWSPDGKLVLVSSTDLAGKKLAFSVLDAAGKEVFKPGTQTLPEKCAFTEPKIFYCAIPRTILSSWIMPDDYLRGEANTADRIVMIDAAKKTITDVFDEENFDMSNIAVTKDKTYLFFVNRTDGTLWRVKLK